MSNLPPPIQSQVARECPYCLEKFIGMILIPEISGMQDLPARVTHSQIEVDGMGSEIVRMRTERKTIEEISASTPYSEDQIRFFLAEYQKLMPAERVNVVERSVFNVAAEHQRNYADLVSMLEDIVANPDMTLKVRTEMRKHMEFGMKMVTILEELKRDAEYKSAVLDLIVRFIEPSRKPEAMAALQQYRHTLSLTKGPG